MNSPMTLRPRPLTLLIAGPPFGLALVLVGLGFQALSSGDPFQAGIYFWLAAPCAMAGLPVVIFATGTSLKLDDDTLSRRDLYGLRRRSIGTEFLAGIREIEDPLNPRREWHRYAIVDRRGVRFAYLRGLFWNAAEIDRLRESIGWASGLDEGIKLRPFVDPTYGDEEARTLRAAIQQGGLQLVEEALSATGDPTRREFLIQVLGSFRGRPPWVDRWVQAMPASEHARVVWGVQATNWALEARAMAMNPADAFAQRAGDLFLERMRLAEGELFNAATMSPDDGAPWLFLMKTGMALELGESEVRLRYDALSQRNPNSEEGARTLTAALSPRWAGSEDSMWAFVRSQTSTAVAGSPLQMLIPMAHIECWIGERDRSSGANDPNAYFEQQQVREEIIEAHRRYFVETPTKSPYERSNREWFALCFYLMRELEAARREIEQIGLGIRPLPFGFLGDALTAYAAVRKAVGLS